MNYYFYEDKDLYNEPVRTEEYIEKDVDIREIYEISRTTTRLESISFS